MEMAIKLNPMAVASTNEMMRVRTIAQCQEHIRSLNSLPPQATNGLSLHHLLSVLPLGREKDSLSSVFVFLKCLEYVRFLTIFSERQAELFCPSTKQTFHKSCSSCPP